MLNAEAEMTRPPKASKGKPKETLGHWGVTWKQIVKTVIERHRDIEGQFFTGAGLRLQRIDSELCEAVILAMMKHSAEIVVLPVHDSFIVHHGYKVELMGMMLGAYCVKYGNIPLPKASEDMVVEITGVPEWGSWSSNPIDHDDLNDLLELAEIVPSEIRLNLFRQLPG